MRASINDVKLGDLSHMPAPPTLPAPPVFWFVGDVLAVEATELAADTAVGNTRCANSSLNRCESRPVTRASTASGSNAGDESSERFLHDAGDGVRVGEGLGREEGFTGVQSNGVLVVEMTLGCGATIVGGGGNGVCIGCGFDDGGGTVAAGAGVAIGVGVGVGVTVVVVAAANMARIY